MNNVRATSKQGKHRRTFVVWTKITSKDKEMENRFQQIRQNNLHQVPKKIVNSIHVKLHITPPYVPRKSHHCIHLLQLVLSPIS
uniref:Uncharacterized protein n=1 Tax=Nelumbo nucifera TaxID=4432 RepID=A0A822Z866_NELNU|nr:TPA_asm: hypothetical protein HUJ06_015370 [Nelumbo nucifera]